MACLPKFPMSPCVDLGGQVPVFDNELGDGGTFPGEGRLQMDRGFERRGCLAFQSGMTMLVCFELGFTSRREAGATSAPMCSSSPEHLPSERNPQNFPCRCLDESHWKYPSRYPVHLFPFFMCSILDCLLWSLFPLVPQVTSGDCASSLNFEPSCSSSKFRREVRISCFEC